MSSKKTAGTQQRELKNINKEILNNFYKLVNNHSHERVRAATSTFKILTNYSKNNPALFNENLNYCIDRLVAGLSSSRDKARNGYSILLLEILESFSVSTERLLSIAEQKFGNLNRETVLDNLVGYFLLVALILKSSNLQKSKLNAKHVDRVTKLLLRLWDIKSYFEYLIANIIVENIKFLHPTILNHIPPDAFNSDSKISSHDLLLILLCNNVKPIKQFIELERSDLMKHASLVKEEKILKRPLHPLLIELSAFFAKHKPQLFEDYYDNFLMPTLFVKNHNEKAALGLDLTSRLLSDNRFDESAIKVILSEHVVRILHNLTRVHEQLHPDCIQFSNRLRDYFTQPESDKRQVMILKALIYRKANDTLIENLLKVSTSDTAEVYLRSSAQAFPKKKLSTKQLSIVGTRIKVFLTKSIDPLLDKLFEGKASHKVWKNYVTFVKKQQDLADQKKLTPITTMFFIYALQMVEHNREPLKQIEELLQCAENAVKSESIWADVLTDQILSLLSSTEFSTWDRKLCVQAFRRLISFISIDAVKLITDVVKSCKDEDNSDKDDLSEDDESEDDESEDDESEDDESDHVDRMIVDDEINEKQKRMIVDKTAVTSDDDEEYLDDDAMMKLDPLIAEAFIANRKTDDSMFRLRCLDLVECIVKKTSDSQVLKLVLNDLTSTRNCSGPLSTKIKNILKLKPIAKCANVAQ